MAYKKEVIIDGRKHLVGRLASKVAKELLKGHNIVVLRCEELIYSGSVRRNYIKYQKFLNKRMNTNPKRGPFHKRSPREIFKRTVRGMLPYKTKRGSAALDRLKTFEGIPIDYQKQDKMVVECALEVTRLKPHRKRTVLGNVSKTFGWHHGELIEELEEKRKKRNLVYYNKKQEEKMLREEAEKNCAAELKEANEILARFGYD